jgi:hypothetical protein
MREGGDDSPPPGGGGGGGARRDTEDVKHRDGGDGDGKCPLARGTVQPRKADAAETRALPVRAAREDVVVEEKEESPAAAARRTEEEEAQRIFFFAQKKTSPKRGQDKQYPSRGGRNAGRNAARVAGMADWWLVVEMKWEGENARLRGLFSCGAARGARNRVSPTPGRAQGRSSRWSSR